MSGVIPLVPPPDDELIVGLVAAVGIDLEQLTAELRAVLSEFGYRSHDLHLTDVFSDFDWPAPLVDKPFDERVWSYMDAGDALCEVGTQRRSGDVGSVANRADPARTSPRMSNVRPSVQLTFCAR